jgi:signal transduction histidine kinase
LAIENAKLYWDMIQAREELVAEEKKALLGQMIVSLNHEINNPLSIISMEAQLLQRRRTDPEGAVEARLHNIETNIDRIKTILERISELDIDDHQAIDYLGAKQMLNLQ